MPEAPGFVICEAGDECVLRPACAVVCGALSFVGLALTIFFTPDYAAEDLEDLALHSPTVELSRPAISWPPVLRKHVCKARRERDYSVESSGGVEPFAEEGKL